MRTPNLWGHTTLEGNLLVTLLRGDRLIWRLLLGITEALFTLPIGSLSPRIDVEKLGHLV